MTSELGLVSLANGCEYFLPGVAGFASWYRSLVFLPRHCFNSSDQSLQLAWIYFQKILSTLFQCTHLISPFKNGIKTCILKLPYSVIAWLVTMVTCKLTEKKSQGFLSSLFPSWCSTVPSCPADSKTREKLSPVSFLPPPPSLLPSLPHSSLKWK